MKMLAGFLIAATLAPCSCASRVGIGGIDTIVAGAPVTALPSIGAAADADHAEVALYVSMKFVEAAVAGINGLHANGRIDEARYVALVSGSNSIAKNVQKNAAGLEAGISLWRTSGTKPVAFNENASSLAYLIAQVAGAVK